MTHPDGASGSGLPVPRRLNKRPDFGYLLAGKQSGMAG
jgi:hypothetical protein